MIIPEKVSIKDFEDNFLIGNFHLILIQDSAGHSEMHMSINRVDFDAFD